MPHLLSGCQGRGFARVWCILILRRLLDELDDPRSPMPQLSNRCVYRRCGPLRSTDHQKLDVEVSTRLDCGGSISLADKASHLSSHCPNREVSCPKCDEQCKAHELSEHTQACRGRLEACVLCGEMVYEAEMPRHCEHTEGHISGLLEEVKRLRAEVAEFKQEHEQREAPVLIVEPQPVEAPPPPIFDNNRLAMLVQHAEQVLRQAREPIHLPAPEVPARVQQLPEEPEAPPDPALGLLASGGDEVGVIKIWNLGTGELATRLWGHRDIPFSLCCVSSTTLASSSADRTIKVWDLELGTCTSSLESYYAIRSVCSLTARTLVSAEDGAIKIWDLVTGRFQHLQAPAFIESVCPLTPTTVATAGTSGIHIWDITAGRCLNMLGDLCANSICAPSSTQLFVAGSFGTNYFIDVPQCQTWTFLGHTNAVQDVCCFTQTTVASASKDCTAKVWDCSTGTCIQTLQHAAGLCSICAVSPSTLATGSRDSTVKLWHVNSGVCTRRLAGHTGFVRCLCPIMPHA